MNIYLRELKANRKSLFIWSMAMVFLVMAGVGKYTAASATGSGSFNDLLKDMPTSLKNLFGVGFFDLSKLVDYFGILYLYIALLAAIHAVLLGNGIIAKEERDKTAEFLFVKPVSRINIITSKLLSALTMVIILNLVTYLVSYIMFIQNSDGEAYALPLFKLMISLLVIQIIFTVLGAVLAAFFSNHKLSSPIATGILLAMFMLSVMIDISGKLDFLRYLSLFKYYDAKDILTNGFQIVYVILSLFFIVIFTLGTYYYYKKRDIKI